MAFQPHIADNFGSEMAYYRITILDTDGNIRKGVREDPISDVDIYYGKALQRAKAALKHKFKDIEVVMLVTNGPEVAAHIRRIVETTRGSSSPGSFKGKLKYDAYGAYFASQNEKQNDNP